MTGVDWTSAVLVLVAGAAVGLVVARRARAAAPLAAAPVPPVDRERRDLEGRRDALLQQLRDLAASGPETPARARERYALELEAARVLLALDARQDQVMATDVHGHEHGHEHEHGRDAAGERKAAVRGFAWGFATASALALLAFFVTRDARPRGEGQEMTGDIPGAAPAAGEAAPVDADEQALRARVARDPDDHEARLDLARAHLARQDMLAVWNETQAVLARAPGHPRALSYQALVRLAMGQGDAAVGMLQEALRRDPDLLEAHLHMILVQWRTGDTAGAERTLAEALRRFPGQRRGIEGLMSEIRRTVPDVEPPAAAAGGQIAGVVEAGSATVPPGGLLFITVRAEGAEGGPPIAVQRLPAALPARFAIGAADSMMGQELPPVVRVEARVDADGDPLTRSPQDPSARLDGVRLGAKDLRLVLR